MKSVVNNGETPKLTHDRHTPRKFKIFRSKTEDGAGKGY